MIIRLIPEIQVFSQSGWRDSNRAFMHYANVSDFKVLPHCTGPCDRTLGGTSEPGYSRWSSLFHRCMSLITMGLLKSTSWKPVTLAPPCMKRSRLMSLKPCQSKEGEGVRNTERERGGERLLKRSWQCSATIREIPQTFISSSPLWANSVHSQRAARESTLCSSQHH